MNQRIKFLEIMLSDLVSERDTIEMELNRVLNDETPPTIHRKIDFDKLLGDITITNNKIKIENFSADAGYDSLKNQKVQ